jgi:hypothetical protein
MVSEVLQCFHFKERRGRDNTHFRRGKENATRLLFQARRGDQRMQRCSGMRQRPTARVRAASRLTQIGRQPFGPVGLKVCLV